jgi:hypothetical protein
VTAPTVSELQTLMQRISERVGRQLERKGWLVRDAESTYLDSHLALETDEEEASLKELQGHSITYRIALGPRKGRKAFRLQSLSALTGDRAGEPVAQAAGFSLHAGVAAAAHQRKKLERLCRYITRPPVAVERLSLTPQGNIRYALKTPYRDGTTHVIFEPLDFLARLASLVPSPRVNLTRFHGVFSANHRLRAQVVPAQRGRGDGPPQAPGAGEKVSLPRHVAMTWAQRLARVFKIDVTTCERCGGAVKIIACIENPTVVARILEHLKRASSPELTLPPARAPP